VSGAGPAGLAAGAVLGVLALSATRLLSARITARIGADALTRTRGRIVAAYLAAPYRIQRTVPDGRLQELVVGDAARLAHGAHRAAGAVSSALTLCTLAVLALVVSPVTTAAMLGSLAVAGACVPLLARRWPPASRRAAGATGRVAERVSEVASVAGELRVFGVTGRATRRLERHLATVSEQVRAGMVRGAVLPHLGRDAALVALVPTLLLVVWLREVPLTTLSVVTVLVLRALAQGSSLLSATHALAEGDDHRARVEESLRRWRVPPEPGPGAATAAGPGMGRGAGALTLDRVGVTYPGAARPALAGVYLRLRRGERLGVVGPSGAGKSTLAGVLLGLVPPDRGRVLVDGVDRATIDPDDWFARVAAVSQQPAMLTGTVADNIRFLRTGIPDEAVAAAAAAAGLDGEIANWPAGLDHDVGPNGSELSGGQRQRVALARALVRVPELIVLDEPSSALDVHAELSLRRALAGLGPDTAVVVIAHRMSTVLDCDRVAVLDGGRLVALGPPAELATRDGYFRSALSGSAPPGPALAGPVLSDVDAAHGTGRTVTASGAPGR
jgi:ABC-type multidrug transport system fused ATPase/permease subunit